METQAIDLRDLCVGSYVKDRHGWNLVVLEVCHSMVECRYRNMPALGRATYSVEDLRAIPLKGRLIERMGLVRDDIATWQRYAIGTNGLYLEWIGDGFTLVRWLTKGGAGIKLTARLHGLHHLQNLAWLTERVWLTLDPTTNG